MENSLTFEKALREHKRKRAAHRRAFIAEAISKGFPEKVVRAYVAQADAARRRGIEWKFELEDWWAWWQQDDRWSRRGAPHKERLVMGRHGDKGPYEPGNVSCITSNKNFRDGSLRGRGYRDHHNCYEHAVVTPQGTFVCALAAAYCLRVGVKTIMTRARLQEDGFRWADHPDPETVAAARAAIFEKPPRPPRRERRMKFLASVCLGLALVTPAHAEFLLRSPTPPAVAAPAPPPSSVVALPARRRPAPPLPVAQGFGEAVPLEMAARMIVPEGTRVTYGEGIDTEAPVDWTGGRPWNVALADAIKPLGLKMTRATNGVTISR